MARRGRRYRARLVLRGRCLATRGRRRGDEAVRGQGCGMGGPRRRRARVARPRRADEGVLQRDRGVDGRRRGGGVHQAVLQPERFDDRTDVGRPGRGHSLRPGIPPRGAPRGVLQVRRRRRDRGEFVDGPGVGTRGFVAAGGVPGEDAGGQETELLAADTTSQGQWAGPEAQVREERDERRVGGGGRHPPQGRGPQRHRRLLVPDEHPDGPKGGRVGGSAHEPRVRRGPDRGQAAGGPEVRRGCVRRVGLLGAVHVRVGQRSNLRRGDPAAVRVGVCTGHGAGEGVLRGGARVGGRGGVLGLPGQGGRRVGAAQGRVAGRAVSRGAAGPRRGDRDPVRLSGLSVARISGSVREI